SNNGLTRLPALPQSLIFLYCGYNQLQALNIPEGLRGLYCSNNQLQTLRLPSSIIALDCSDNPLVFLTPPPESLKYFTFPKHLGAIHYDRSRYYERYQTYFYLISFLVLEIGVLPTILSNEEFWFPGQL